MGLDDELEDGTMEPNTNVTNDDFLLTGKIASAHLNEFPDHYTRVPKIDKEADEFWRVKNRVVRCTNYPLVSAHAFE